MRFGDIEIFLKIVFNAISPFLVAPASSLSYSRYIIVYKFPFTFIHLPFGPLRSTPE